MLTIPHFGAPSCHGQSMLIIPSSPPPLVYPHSSASLGSNHPCSQEMQESEAGVPSALHFVRRCRQTWKLVHQALLRTAKRSRVQANRHWLLASVRDRRSGCPPRIYHCGWSPVSLPHATLALSRLSTGSITLTIPAIWRKAHVVAILKPKKPAEDAKSYRLGLQDISAMYDISI